MSGPVFLPGDDVTLRTIEEEDLEFLQTQINDPRIWRPTGRSTPLNGEGSASSSRTSSVTTMRSTF